MWMLRTFSLVPRPDLMGLAPLALMLGTFLAFRDREVTLRGQPVLALPLAVAVYLVAQVTRNAVLALGRRALRARIWPLVALWPVAALLAWEIATAGAARPVQHGYAAYLLAMAVLWLAAIRVAPELMHLMPSPWARAAPPHMRAQAMSLVALSGVLRAIACEALARWGTETAWMLFVTLGSVAVYLLAHWVVVLMLLDDAARRR